MRRSQSSESLKTEGRGGETHSQFVPLPCSKRLNIAVVHLASIWELRPQILGVPGQREAGVCHLVTLGLKKAKIRNVDCFHGYRMIHSDGKVTGETRGK